MKVEWYIGKNSPPEKAKIKALLRANRDSLDHLELVLSKKQKDIVFPNDYNIPNWANWQADLNGYNRALKEIIDLIRSVQVEEE